MNKDELIKKWLDNNLNSQEQKAFEQLPDYKEIIRLSNAMTGFKAPEFIADKSFEALKPKIYTKSHKNWYRTLLRIAAVLALGFTIYYYSGSLDTNINTDIAQLTTVELPDTSEVELNANSSITYNNRKWEENREVHLSGEAFFKVAKGKKFDVITNDGIVSVLGTQFNVKQRKNYFEVTCFEGLVSIKYNESETKLKPGNTVKLIDGKHLIAKENIFASAPTWLEGESSFTEIPLKHVISELENHYNLTVDSDEVDTSRLFTGSFTHKNLDLALKSITIPLNLGYNKSGSSIVLRRE